MKAIIQRVASASVSVEGVLSGKSQEGLLILLGVFECDGKGDAEILARKTANLRVFCDGNDKMNLSILDISGQALVISNFTLCANVKKGNRPSFSAAMQPDKANELYEYYIQCLKQEGVVSVDEGVFGGDMSISANLSGPVTIILDTEIWR